MTVSRTLLDGTEVYLTLEAQAERDQWKSTFRSRGCTCCINPPCLSCTDPGNPANQEEDETAWQATDPENKLAQSKWVALSKGESLWAEPDGTCQKEGGPNHG